MTVELIKGDCLEIMPELPDKSIDLILCDLPFGTTECKWDTPIQLDPLWKQYNRIIKDDGAIVLFGIQPFTSVLVTSNLPMFKYSVVWKKSKISHFAQAPYRFLTEHEDILIFSKAGTAKNAKIRMKYNPQGLKDCNKVCRGKGHSDHRAGRKPQKDYIQTKTGYPKSILEFKSDTAKLHPTQKPVPLIEYLIKTYSNKNDLVLDNCAGSGTTGIACNNIGRNSILIEIDLKYCNKINKRLKERLI